MIVIYPGTVYNRTIKESSFIEDTVSRHKKWQKAG